MFQDPKHSISQEVFEKHLVVNAMVSNNYPEQELTLTGPEPLDVKN